MSALRLLLKIYTYVVNAGVTLAALAMSFLILTAPDHVVRIGWLPWSGEDLGSRLAALGVAGVAVIMLSLAGRMRLLLVAFSLVVLIVVTRGLFFSPWQFGSEEALKQALWIVAGLLVSVIGAIPGRKTA